MKAGRLFTSVAGLTLAGFLMTACGGDRGQSPSAVATPAPAPPAAPAFFTVVSGETQAPVAGARVVVAGAELVSDGQGSVSLPAGLSPTTFVDVVAAGFLDRQTQISRAATAGQLTLWPRESPTGLTEHFTSEIVYTTAWTGVEAVPGAEPLTRWASSMSQVSVVYLGPSDDSNYVAFSDRALAVQRAAVDEMNHASGGRVVYTHPLPSIPTPATVGRVQLRILPSLPGCVSSPATWGIATLASDGEYTSATITYCFGRAAEDLGLSVHELGHTYGLRHSSDASDVMRAFGRRTERPNDRERLVMALMMQRPGGNRYPDNDRSARGAASAPRALACRR